MNAKADSYIVSLEEHYMDAELAATYEGHDARRPEIMKQRLSDFDEIRIQQMDEAGIDLQVLSHCAPATQKLKGDGALPLTRAVNDRLYQEIQKHPDRLAGFAALPTADPEASARELERAVRELGFKGTMLHGLANGEFLDKKKYWPIFAAAESLDVPVYIHPGIPHSAVIEAYYSDYVEEFPVILQAGWGYTVEAATQAVRLVLSGVFDAHPNLKIILGHLGEGLPFLLWRLDMAFSRVENRIKSFRDVFSRHFYVTTSGNFSNPALLCSAMELGVDRILFSVDWPFVPNQPATDWIDTMPLCEEDRRKILGENARRLLHL
jgi:2,3-dihydroxybenzoate decarboxylase